MALFDWLLRLLRIAPSERGRPESSGRARGEATAADRQPPRRGESLENLDPGRFAPLSDAEVRRRAGRIGSLWNNPWFGRRDRIPPSDDPRTEIVDRAMVAHGFMTPDELVEIHEVGAEMDRVRPAMAHARLAAAEAVTRSQEERAARKRQKQAEAAERRRRRQEQIKQRRESDIIFLGRGVSRGLADRRSNVEKLESSGLPVLATPADLATAMGLSVPRLRWLAFHTPAATRTHYIRFHVPKRSGGTRTLSAPHRDLKAAQRWVLQSILSRAPVHNAAHGFVPRRSIVTGAGIHVQADVLVGVDLEDFFPSITFARVKGVFEWMGYSPAVATILSLLCTESPRRTVEYAGQVYHVASGPRALPQGAPTSPALSNLVVRRLDARLAGLARKLDWKYTRYADDLSLSARGEAAGKPGYVLACVRHIVEQEGFRLNAAKTRVSRPHTAQRVTGVVVNQRPGAPRTLVRRLRAILHRAGFEGLAAQNRDGHSNFDAWLRGTLAYIRMINPAQAEPLEQALARLTRTTGGAA